MIYKPRKKCWLMKTKIGVIDTDKYEPTEIDTILHYTRAHSPDEWRWPKYSNSLNELSEDDRLLIEYAPRLRAEVIRLREGRLDLINEVVRIINNKTGERVDADLHDYIIDRLVNE